jgi:dihydrofolate reductase
MRLTLHTFLTLDGVLQAPGGREEDTSDGFEHGGWSVPFGDEDENGDNPIAGWFDRAEAFLLGRRTYEIFAGFWPHVTEGSPMYSPVSEKLNTLPKYVASTSLDSVDWQNSQLISGDVADTVRKLKEQPGGELQVHGSGALATYLIDQQLVDEFRLITYPVYLGTGKRLFADGVRPGTLRMLTNSTMPNGVIVATYEFAGAPTYGSYTLDQE